MSFADRYGPWAVITGASEGTGAAFARQVAAEGVNLILIARREGPLSALADDIRATHGVEVVTASIDLTAPDAPAKIIAAAGDREVGLFISNAGSDTVGSMFLDKPMEDWLGLVALNTLTPMQCCHHFAQAMKARGKGGLLLVGSGACHGSGPHMATYSGAKAFNLRFAEGLWAELRRHGIDVLFYALGRTDTPMLRAMLAEKKMPVPDDLADPAEVARVALARLPSGPMGDWGYEEDQAGPGGYSAADRRERIRMITEASRAIFGKKQG